MGLLTKAVLLSVSGILLGKIILTLWHRNQIIRTNITTERIPTLDEQLKHTMYHPQVKRRQSMLLPYIGHISDGYYFVTKGFCRSRIIGCYYAGPHLNAFTKECIITRVLCIQEFLREPESYARLIPAVT